MSTDLPLEFFRGSYLEFLRFDRQSTQQCANFAALCTIGTDDSNIFRGCKYGLSASATKSKG